MSDVAAKVSSLDLSSLDLNRLAAPRILVVGDVMLDEYTWGEVSRISPEAPVPVIAGRHRELKAGGAGSVVENLAVLGARVHICGLLGDDESADRFEEILTRQGVSHRGLIRSSDRPTTSKIRVMAAVQQAQRAQQQICRIDWEEVKPPTAQELARIVEYLDEVFADPPAAVLISDYEKGMLCPELLAPLLARCRQAGVPALVDPGRTVDYGRYRGATLICPNRFEAEQATGIPLRCEDDFATAGGRLIESLDLDYVALTLDRDGIYLACKDGGRHRFPTEARAVADVAGAGDMVLSLLGLAFGSGWSADQAVQLANVGAGIEVSKVGVTPVERWELESAIRTSGPAVKARSVEEMSRIVRRERAAGRRVVFTNGCFDILHVGHLVLLEKARTFGDLLVVGLNSDASISRLKGADRPIRPGTERAVMLSVLPFVDHIVFFDEDTPLAVIQGIVPDVLVKGADYEGREVVGQAEVEASGGRVELVELQPEISTTAIVQRIRGGRDGS